MSKNSSPVVFRVLFSLALLCVAVKGIYEVEDNKGYVSQNIRLIGELLFKGDKFLKFRIFSEKIILLENYLFILAAILFVLRYDAAKMICGAAILIELLFVHNPWFYKESINRITAAQYFALLGVMLCY